MLYIFLSLFMACVGITLFLYILWRLGEPRDQVKKNLKKRSMNHIYVFNFEDSEPLELKKDPPQQNRILCSGMYEMMRNQKIQKIPTDRTTLEKLLNENK